MTRTTTILSGDAMRSPMARAWAEKRTLDKLDVTHDTPGVTISWHVATRTTDTPTTKISAQPGQQYGRHIWHPGTALPSDAIALHCTVAIEQTA